MKARIIGVLSFMFCFYSMSAASVETDMEVYSIASYTESGSELYIAGIYVDDKTRLYRSPAELIQDANAMGFKISRSRLSSKAWGRGLIQQASINGDDWQFRRIAPYLAKFLGVLTQPFVEGDFIQLVKNGSQVHLYLNGVELGSAEQDGMFEMLLGAWLGHIPPSSEFKNTLFRPQVSFAERLRFEHLSDAGEQKGRAESWVEYLEFEGVLTRSQP